MMSVQAHREAEEVFAEGERLLAAGDNAGAAHAFARAAQLEETALSTVPADRVRTRSALAESSVTLWRRAGQLEQAGVAARKFLALELAPSVLDYLLDVASEARWASIAREDGLSSGETFKVALRGAGIRPGGLARLDVVVLKLEQFRNLLIRVGEWTSGIPFRDSGPPPIEISDAVVPLVSPASPGSYTFDLRLESHPVQTELFGYRELDAQAISNAFYELIDTTAKEGPAGVIELVQDEEYQNALMRLVRNVAPSGRDLSEVVVSPATGDREAILLPEVRRSISRVIADRRPEIDGGTIRRGVLRALDLDKRVLVLREGQDESRCRIEEGALLDDVVGPLVNHRVEVRGELRKRTFYVTDLTEADA